MITNNWFAVCDDYDCDYGYRYREPEPKNEPDYGSNVQEPVTYARPKYTRSKKRISCRCCDMEGLKWNKINDHWYLHGEDGLVHHCKSNPLSLESLKEIANANSKTFKPSLSSPKLKTFEDIRKNKEKSDKWKDVLSSAMTYDGDDTSTFEAKNRLTKIEYGCLMAIAASSRSEDPHTKVGCCITNIDGRILSSGYNGLLSGQSVPSILKYEEYRDIKRVLFIHAETNALALIREGEGHSIYLTMSPCAACANNIVRHGIQNVIYINEYAMTEEYKHIFKFHGILFRGLDNVEKENINKFVLNNMLISQHKPSY